MTSAFLAGSVLASLLQEKPQMADRAFLELCKAAGGVWRGKLGDKMVMEHRYHVEQNGAVLIDKGWVKTTDGTLVLTIDARYGWDPATKSVYYLDCHNDAEVYFGHATYGRDGIDVRFHSLTTPSDEFHSVARFDSKDQLTFEIRGFDKSGKEILLHGSTIHREKDMGK